MIGQIVNVLQAGGMVMGTVRVNDGDGLGPKEYVAIVPATDAQGNALPAAQVKAALVAEWQRLRSLRPAPPVDITGTVNGNVNL